MSRGLGIFLTRSRNNREKDHNGIKNAWERSHVVSLYLKIAVAPGTMSVGLSIKGVGERQ